VPHGKLASNIPIVEWPGITPGDDIQNLDGFHGPNNNITITLQRRGAVFIACHGSIRASKTMRAVCTPASVTITPETE